MINTVEGMAETLKYFLFRISHRLSNKATLSEMKLLKPYPGLQI